MALTKPKLSQNIDTDISVFTDPILVLHQGSTLANVDTGFLFNRANGLVSNVAIYWSESANSFVTAFTTSSGAPDANVAPTQFANIRLGTATANVLQSDEYRYSNGAAFVSTTLANTAEVTANLASGENVGLSLTATGVAAGNYGSATSIPTIVVDSKGRITSLTANAVSTTINLAGTSGSGSVAGGGTLTVNGTTNQITTSVSSSTITIALATDVTAPGNLTVTGNLTVQGNTTTFNTETLTVEDKLITISNGAATASAADGSGINVAGANANLIYVNATDTWNTTKGLIVPGANITTANISSLTVTGITRVAGNLVANSGTASSNTNSGALVVVGGAGIAGNVYADKFYVANGMFWSGNGNVFVPEQSSFTQIAVTGGNTLVANSGGTSTLTIVGGSGISVVADSVTDTLTFTTISTAESIWTTDHDSGLVTEAVVLSEDNGLVADPVTDEYDLGTITITGVVTGDAIAVNSMPGDRLITGTDISVGNISAAGNITFTGNMGIGTSNIPSNKDTVTPKFIVSGSGVAGSMQVVRNTTVGGGGAILELTATRGADVNSYTILQSGDGIGSVIFGGADGNEFVQAAAITAQVDGTPGDNDMPGRLIFSTTADGASSVTERMRINNAGNMGIGTVSPSGRLHVESSSGGLPLYVNSTASAQNARIRLNSTDNASSVSYVMSYSHASLNKQAAMLLGGTGAVGFYVGQTAGAEPTTGTLAQTIDSSGNFMVGTTSPTARLTVAESGNAPAGDFYTSGGAVGTPCMYVKKQPNDGTTSQVYVQFLFNNASNGNGQINGNGSGAAAFGSYSDVRLKENIVDLPPQLENICALRPVEFDYIESEGGGHQTGFIAQEIQQVYPDTVGIREPDEMLTVTGWSKTEARLVKAIQELKAELDATKAEVAALKGA
jgi:hypothetical protein